MRLLPSRSGVVAARAAASDQPAQRKPSADVLAWQAAGLHCSANERRADEASRDVEAWLKCTYMQGHLGEVMSGTVSAATGFGIFVTLDQVSVEGLVHITELGGEYFRFDEARQELRGERSGMRYGIGTKVVVQVAKVDLDGRRIDLALVPNDAVIGSLITAKKSAERTEQSFDKTQGSATSFTQTNANRNGANNSNGNGNSDRHNKAASRSSAKGKKSNANKASDLQQNFLVDAPGPFVSPVQAARKTKPGSSNKRSGNSVSAYSASPKSKPAGKASPIAKAKANAKATSKTSAKSGVKDATKSSSSGAKKRR